MLEEESLPRARRDSKNRKGKMMDRETLALADTMPLEES